MFVCVCVIVLQSELNYKNFFSHFFYEQNWQFFSSFFFSSWGKIYTIFSPSPFAFSSALKLALRFFDDEKQSFIINGNLAPKKRKISSNLCQFLAYLYFQLPYDCTSWWRARRVQWTEIQWDPMMSVRFWVETFELLLARHPFWQKYPIIDPPRDLEGCWRSEESEEKNLKWEN